MTQGISIHAPARGATLYPAVDIMAELNFNPRSREGSDCIPGNNQDRISISIHAPARGATSSITSGINEVNDFNPRSREGSDR